jgi:amino acid transporter
MNASLDAKSQAAAMKVGTSNYVATSALAVIGGASALYVYVSQNFEPTASFYGSMLLGLALLVASIVLGGLGADDATADVAKGSWSLSSGGDYFNLQSVLTLLGLLCVLAATGLGVSSDRRESTVEARVTTLEQQLRQLRITAPRP